MKMTMLANFQIYISAALRNKFQKSNIVRFAHVLCDFISLYMIAYFCSKIEKYHL